MRYAPKALFFAFGNFHYGRCSCLDKARRNGKQRDCNCQMDKKLNEELKKARAIVYYQEGKCLCGCQDLRPHQEQRLLNSNKYKDAMALLIKHEFILE